MSQYAWICLSNAEYDWLNMPTFTWKNRVLDMLEFWMCLMLDIVSGNCNCTNYWAVIKKETYSRHCPTFKIELFPKIIMLECRCKTFQGKARKWRRRGGWGVELEHFDKDFDKKTQKEAPQVNILEFFLLDTLKATFWMENLT